MLITADCQTVLQNTNALFDYWSSYHLFRLQLNVCPFIILLGMRLSLICSRLYCHDHLARCTLIYSLGRSQVEEVQGIQTLLEKLKNAEVQL